jgi:nicotinamidase-related amidase
MLQVHTPSRPRSVRHGANAAAARTRPASRLVGGTLPWESSLSWPREPACCPSTPDRALSRSSRCRPRWSSSTCRTTSAPKTAWSRGWLDGGLDGGDGNSRPRDESRVLIKDTWNTEIVDALAPETGDIVVPKRRFSGFFETDLDAILKEHGIDTLVFTGCTTSVCVESTLRDAFFRDYRCLLLADCTAEPVGSELAQSNYEASLRLVATYVGWVSDSSTFLRALATAPVAHAPRLSNPTAGVA